MPFGQCTPGPSYPVASAAAALPAGENPAGLPPEGGEMRAAGDLRGPPAVGDTRGLGAAAPEGRCAPRGPSAVSDPRAAFPPLMPTCTPVAATTLPQAEATFSGPGGLTV